MHEKDLFVLTHRLQCGSPPSHFWTDDRRQRGKKMEESGKMDGPLCGFCTDGTVRFRDQHGAEGRGDGPTRETSGWSGHWRGVSDVDLVLGEEEEGEEGRGMSEEVERVLVIIPPRPISSLYQS